MLPIKMRPTERFSNRFEFSIRRARIRSRKPRQYFQLTINDFSYIDGTHSHSVCNSVCNWLRVNFMHMRASRCYLMSEIFYISWHRHEVQKKSITNVICAAFVAHSEKTERTQNAVCSRFFHYHFVFSIFLANRVTRCSCSLYLPACLPPAW